MKKNDLAKHLLSGNMKVEAPKRGQQLRCSFCGAPFGPKMMIYGTCCAERKESYKTHPDL